MQGLLGAWTAQWEAIPPGHAIVQALRHVHSEIGALPHPALPINRSLSLFPEPCSIVAKRLVLSRDTVPLLPLHNFAMAAVLA